MNSNAWHLVRWPGTSLHDIRMVRVALISLMWGWFAFWTITRWPTVWKLEKFKACTAARRAVLHTLRYNFIYEIWVREHVDLRICTLHFSAYGSFWKFFLERQSWISRALWHHLFAGSNRANNKTRQAAASSYTKAAKNMKQVLVHIAAIRSSLKKTYESGGQWR